MKKEFEIRVALWLKIIIGYFPLIFGVMLLTLSATSAVENDFRVQVFSFLIGVFFIVAGLLLLYRHATALISLENDSIYIYDLKGIKTIHTEVDIKEIQSIGIREAPLPTPFIILKNGNLIKIPEMGHNTFKVIEQIERWIEGEKKKL